MLLTLETIIHATYGSTLLHNIFAILVVFYSPFAIYQLYLMTSSILNSDKAYFKKQTRLEKDNNVIIALTTNGMATDVVEKIISTINSYGLDVKIFVIKEPHDSFKYSCMEIVVPITYQCPNHSRCKMRAMQYGNEWFHEKGYGDETYICHLDDDSLVDKDYLEYIIHYMTGAGGQGCIRLREFGRHMISSLADLVRVSNCEAWCKPSNKKNRPQFVHGEGIVVRADIEYEIGWDYGTYGAEDLIMGLKIAHKYSFSYIPSGHIYLAPPTTAKDYFKQRRRWFWSIFKNDGIVRKLSLKTYLFYIYMYAVGVTGLISLTLFPVLIFVDAYITPVILALCIINIISFFGYYQFGAVRCDHMSCSFVLLMMQIPIAYYDGLTILYSLITRPNFQVFETIKKV
jgi:cellulose synthase/poly-beta-1,6-N-acetylglucosamine synthase-like glycosyltransferase